MEDLVEQPLEVGDTVAMCVPYYSYLVLGTVHKLTPKGATISWVKDKKTEHTSRGCDQLVKV